MPKLSKSNFTGLEFTFTINNQGGPFMRNFEYTTALFDEISFHSKEINSNFGQFLDLYLKRFIDLWSFLWEAQQVWGQFSAGQRGSKFFEGKRKNTKLLGWRCDPDFWGLSRLLWQPLSIQDEFEICHLWSNSQFSVAWNKQTKYWQRKLFFILTPQTFFERKDLMRK